MLEEMRRGLERQKRGIEQQIAAIEKRLANVGNSHDEQWSAVKVN